MITHTLFIFLAIFIFQVSGLSDLKNDDFPRVITPLGVIRGFYNFTYKNRRYKAFDSIPYAKPPVGNLRYEPPVPIEAWTGELDATNKPPKCVQPNLHKFEVIGQEDCLYLNVYVPDTQNTTSAFPVIFYIHGGYFHLGYSWTYRPTHILDKDVILVTINYRLGPFGFISLNDGSIPGNMGLKDQSMALKWVNENIGYFGGDKKRITLMGCSSGGSSVHYHYLSPMSAGLFRNGISSSGTALSPWAFNKDLYRRDIIIWALSMNCKSVIRTEDIIQCFKEKSVFDICFQWAQLFVKEYLDIGIVRTMFQPIAENINKNYFINRPPEEIIDSKKFYDVPWIAGTVSGEGDFFTKDFRENQTRLSYVNENWNELGPYLMMLQNRIEWDKFNETAKAIRQHYFGNKSFVVDDEIAEGFVKMVGDANVRYDVQRAVKLHATASNSSVRLYYFDFYKDKALNPRYYGTPHCLDCHFIFANDNFNSSRNQNVTLLLDHLVHFLYSVASGDDDSWMSFWPPFSPDLGYIQYNHIKGINNITYKLSYNFAENKFWDQIFAQYKYNDEY